MGNDDSNEIMDVVQWNSVVDSVNKNSKAIEELKAIPDALSELKSLVLQMLPNPEDDIGYDHESDMEDGQLDNDSDDLGQTVKELMRGNFTQWLKSSS